MLETLSQLYPISGLLHVGAGNGGAVEAYRRWNARRVILVEADVRRAERLEEIVADLDSYQALHGLVAGENGEASFFVATNRNESGLVDPRRLVSIWRNLDTLGCEVRESFTIATLMAGLSAPFSPGELNWLIVECLSSLEILQGTGALLDSLDVVVARAVDDHMLAFGNCEKSVLDAYMTEKGFRPGGVKTERHPALCNVVYLRDWKSRVLKGDERHAELLACRDEELAALRKELDRQAIQSKGSAVVLAALSAERDELSVVAKLKAEELEATTRAAYEQAELVASRNEELAALRKDFEREAEARQAKIQQLAEEAQAASKTCYEQMARAQQLAGELEAVKAALAQEREVGQAETQRLAMEAKTLATARDEQVARAQQLAGELEAAKAALAQEREAGQAETQRLAMEAKTLATARDEQAARARQLTEELEAAKAKSEWRAKELETARGQIATLESKLKESESERTKLNKNQLEMDERSKMIDSEITRAEVQIELIEEVLLREKAF